MAKSLSEAIFQKFENQEDCDVFFIVDGKQLGTHRLVLKVQNEVLYDLSKEWNPGLEPVSIETMDYDTFKELLRYMYTEEASLSHKNIFVILYAAIHFKMPQLERLCCDYISRSMNVENVCFFMNEAIHFESKVLQEMCLQMFSKHAAAILEDESFLGLSQPALSIMLDVEETNLLEVELFRSIRHWMEQKCKEQNLPVNGVNMRQVVEDTLYKIRFPSMTSQDFGNVVCTIKGLLTEREEAQIFKKIIIFDNKDIECPFSNKIRCHFNYFDTPLKDTSQLFNTDVIYNMHIDQSCRLDSILQYAKDLPDDNEIDLTSFRLVLQCCADLANSSGTFVYTSSEDKITRKELHEDFLTWKDKVSNNNICDIMTKFMDIRCKLNDLCAWYI